MAQTSQRLASRPQSRVPSRTASARDGDDDRLRNTPHARNNDPTIAYIKKILCPQPPSSDTSPGGSTGDVGDVPLEELLPPLTSSNDLDVQLYALVAVILSNFVQTWYNRITPDQQFVAEIVQIIAHCTRGLEQRLRKVDLESLLLDEIPDLLVAHVRAIRICKSSTSAPLEAYQVQLRYHALRPHVALEPLPLDDLSMSKQQENETAWCLLLVNRILPLLLPPEDLQNPCLDVLVSEVFAELIFRNGICGKACEPWLIWDGVAKLLRSLRSGRKTTLPEKTSSTVPLSRLEEFGLLASARTAEDPAPREHPRRRFDHVSRTFWIVMQGIWTLSLVLRASMSALMQAKTLPARTIRKPPNWSMSESKTLDGRVDTPATTPLKGPIIDMHVWSCLSEASSMGQRMPWLSGFLSLVQWTSLHGPGKVCQTNGRLDRLMSFHLHERVLTARWLPAVLQAARLALFPNNALAPPRKPPTPEEVVQIRRECAEAIVDAIPTVVGERFFATKDVEVMREDVEENVLDLLNDAYINKHLVVALVDLLAVRLFPELAAVH